MNERTRLPTPPSPLQQAFDNYRDMEVQLALAHGVANDMRGQNAALLSEVNMLREAYERSDSDRIRLQAISSALLGRLLSINDVIGGAVKESIRQGVEASTTEATKKADEELEVAGAEARAIFARVEPEPTQGARTSLPRMDWVSRA